MVDHDIDPEVTRYSSKKFRFYEDSLLSVTYGTRSL